MVYKTSTCVSHYDFATWRHSIVYFLQRASSSTSVGSGGRPATGGQKSPRGSGGGLKQRWVHSCQVMIDL